MLPESGSNVVKPISLGGWKVRDIHGVPSLIFFIVVCWGFLGLYFLPTVWKIHQARSWVKTPCVVEVSWVGKVGDRYEVKIKYSYRNANGKKYISGWYDFERQSSKKKGPKQKIVDTLPPGSRNFCFVNPSNPKEAVFRREAAGSYFIAVAALVMVPLIVMAFLWAVIWRRKAEILRDYQQDVMKGLWPVDPDKIAHGPEKSLKPYKPEIGGYDHDRHIPYWSGNMGFSRHHGGLRRELRRNVDNSGDLCLAQCDRALILFDTIEMSRTRNHHARSDTTGSSVCRAMAVRKRRPPNRYAHEAGRPRKSVVGSCSHIWIVQAKRYETSYYHVSSDPRL